MISFLKKRIIESLRARKSRGFTLIELLVTIVIFVVLTGVVLVSQNNFDNTILLNNLAYDVALTIRQAQTYGINTKESSTGTFSPYGVYFNINPSDPKSSTKSFILFADTNSDGTYGVNGNGITSSCPVGDPECLQRYVIQKGSYIKSVCTGPDQAHCYYPYKATIIFKRPNPSARIYNINGPSDPLQNFAMITVSSSNGILKYIIVTSTGQIYVQ